MAPALPRLATAVLCCIVAPVAVAAPALRLEAGYAQFELEHEDRAAGTAIVLEQEDRYDSGAALRLGLEAGWAASARLEWLLGASLTSAGNADREVRQRTAATATTRKLGLDELHLLNARGGLRWQRERGTPVRWHVDLGVGATHWRYDYRQGGPGQEATDGSFASVDAALGFSFALGPRLEFGVVYGEQYNRRNHNRQAQAGLRYSWRRAAP